VEALSPYTPHNPYDHGGPLARIIHASLEHAKKRGIRLPSGSR
jgi:hypothetical protein